MRTLLLLAIPLVIGACKNKATKAETKQWLLSERTSYRYALTRDGLFDTIFMTKYTYKEGVMADSIKGAIVYQYKKGQPVLLNYFQYKGKELKFQGFKESAYDTSGKLLEQTKIAGKVLEYRVTNAYDTNGQLKSMVGIGLSRNKGRFFDQAAFEAASGSMDSVPSYDTVKVEYQYDTDKKVIGTKTYNLRGQLLATVINYYAGNDPLMSVELNRKNDTVEIVRFEPQQKSRLKMTADSKHLVNQKWLGPGNVTLGEIVEDKATGRKRKIVNYFDPNGRMSETKVYEMN